MNSKEFKPRTIIRVPNQTGGSSQLRRFLTLRATVLVFYPHMMDVIEPNTTLRYLAITKWSTGGGRVERLEGTPGR